MYLFIFGEINSWILYFFFYKKPRKDIHKTNKIQTDKRLVWGSDLNKYQLCPTIEFGIHLWDVEPKILDKPTILCNVGKLSLFYGYFTGAFSKNLAALIPIK